MKPEQQRIAISEACGMKYHKPTPEEIASGSYYQYEPDYLNDLNAMNEAEKQVLCKDVHLYLDYASRLNRIVGGEIDALFATAAQRAEAFLRTLGKWDESQSTDGKASTESGKPK